MSRLRLWWHCARPKTLWASVSPVLLATGLAAKQGAADVPTAFLCLGFAVFAQVAANFANDRFDGVRGADAPGRIGPARGVATGRISARAMGLAALGALGVAGVFGLGALACAWDRANPAVLLGLGAACLAGAPLYSRAAYRGLGDVFVVAYFGLAAVGGCVYAQAGSVGGGAWVFALCAGALCDNILIVNNTRDIDDDRRSGKRTLAARFGRGFARAQYGCALVAGVVLLPAFAAASWGAHWLVAWALVPFAAKWARRFAAARGRGEWDAVLAATARFLLFWSALCALCLCV